MYGSRPVSHINKKFEILCKIWKSGKTFLNIFLRYVEFCIHYVQYLDKLMQVLAGKQEIFFVKTCNISTNITEKRYTQSRFQLPPHSRNTVCKNFINQGGNNTKSTVIFAKLKILIKSKSPMSDLCSIIINHHKQFYLNWSNKSPLATNLKTIILYDSAVSLRHQ